MLLLLALAGPAGIPRMLCSIAVSGVMLPTVPDLHRNAWKKVPGQLALRERRRRSTYCC